MPTSTNTPTTVTISVAAYRETSILGCLEYNFYVNGQEYKELPLDANVREPNEQKSKPYKDMCETLRENPENFFENNLGISVIASQVEKKSEKKFVLHFRSGTGILNGGHTQLAILKSQYLPQVKNAIVKITVRVKDYSTERIAEIAAAQNSSTAVKEYSLAEKKGLFVKLKRFLDSDKEKHIVWWEGRDVPNGNGIAPPDLIALINVFNIDLYQSSYTSVRNQPTGSSNGKGTVFSKWEKDPGTYEKLYPLVNDMIYFGEYIRCNFHKGTGITKLKVISDGKGKGQKAIVCSAEQCAYELPTQFFYPLIASFRANVYYDEEKRKIGWKKDCAKLFDDVKKSLCDKLMSFYKSSYSNNINKASKDPNLYESLYLEVLSRVVGVTEPFVAYDI